MDKTPVWKLAIGDAPADLAMTLTFVDGKILERGLDVGTYRLEPDKLVASIGTDLTVEASGDESALRQLIATSPGARQSISAVATTQIPGDEPLVEPAAFLPSEPDEGSAN